MKFPEIEPPDVESTAKAAPTAEPSSERRQRSSECVDVNDGSIATTRRRVLGGIVGATAAGLAGCSSLTGGGGGGETEWAEWVPVDLVDTDRSGAQAGHFELSSLFDEFPSSYTDEAEFGSIARQLGLSEGDIEEAVSISENDTTDHVVLLGSFSGSTVTDRFPVEPTSYEGYDVLDGELAVDDDVIVTGGAYERIIDAREGNATNLLEAEGEWPDVVENISSETVLVVERADSEDAWEVAGAGFTGDGSDTISVTAYAHFASADGAASNQDAVQQDLSTPDAPDDTPMTVDSVSVDGNVVVVEGTTQADEL